MVAGEARWQALGTSVHLLVTDGERLESARAAVEAVLAGIDLAYSRFRADSELSRVHERPGQEVRVSPLLVRAIGVALRAAELTDGAVDPTVGRTMRAIGYDGDFEAIRGGNASPEIRLVPVPGWQAIALRPASRMLRVPAGVEIDLDSTGKALAADLAAGAALGAVGAGGVLLNLGGDIATAGTAPDGGWRILATDDSRTRPDGPGEVVAIASGGLATSSTTVRRWRWGAAEVHHIVDPATGRPADGPWRTVSVLAADCVDANTAATAGIVRGRTAPDWLAGLGLPARLVSTTGEVTRIGGWPAPFAQRSPEARP